MEILINDEWVELKTDNDSEVWKDILLFDSSLSYLTVDFTGNHYTRNLMRTLKETSDENQFMRLSCVCDMLPNIVPVKSSVFLSF